MLVGGSDTGKTRLSLYLVEQLAAAAGTVGLVSADMGQPSLGVPTCLGLALSEPWHRAAALWFVGDVSPRGNLLPTVAGTARLVRLARAKGAQSVVVDTTGLVGGVQGRVLKYHKAVLAGVDRTLALQRSSELEEMLSVLGGVCPAIYRLRPAAQARDRSPLERKLLRQTRYREHFLCGDVFEFDPGRLVGLDWTAGPSYGRGEPAPGTVVGLLDPSGFCLGLGIIEELFPRRLRVYSAWKDAESVMRVQVGRVRLDRHADFSEMH
jgi:polynucleotide 5'-kinase involved in rRNA processing